MEIGTQYEMFGDRSTQPTSQNDLKATRPIHPLERKKPPNNQVNDHFHPQFLLSTITLHPSRAISPAWFVNDHQLDKIPSHFPHNLSRSNRRLLWEVNQPTNPFGTSFAEELRKDFEDCGFPHGFPKSFLHNYKEVRQVWSLDRSCVCGQLDEFRHSNKYMLHTWRSKVVSGHFELVEIII